MEEIREILGALAKLRKANISFVILSVVRPSVRMNNSAPTERIFMKFGI
jgi:hypothetical protein